MVIGARVQLVRMGDVHSSGNGAVGEILDASGAPRRVIKAAMVTRRCLPILSLSLILASGCADQDPAASTSDTTEAGDGDGEGTTNGDGDGDPATAGDGDGDSSGDGDGDSSGDGDGDPTSGDGDGDPSGDGDGDPTSGDGDGDEGPPPEVQQDPTYAFEVTTHVYGQGQQHSDWTGPVTGTIDLELDVWEPIDAPPGRPAVIMIHGGGFVGGSKEAAQIVAFAEYFAERGWVTLSINYRLADGHGTVPDAWANVVGALPNNLQNQGYALYPAARDAKAALRWLHANADTYQVDTNYITSLGGSAGSYLAIVLGVTEPEDFRDEIGAQEDPTLDSTNLDADAEVHTIIDHWGGISHMEVLEIIDGVSRFDPSDAPVSIVHGTADPTVAFSEAENLRDAYIDTGVAYDFHPVEGGGHGLWGVMIEGMNLRELAFAFVVEQQGLSLQP